MNGKTNSSIIPKNRGLLQKGKTLFESLKKPPKKVTTSDFKKNPGKALTTLLNPKHIANVLVSRLHQPLFPTK